MGVVVKVIPARQFAACPDRGQPSLELILSGTAQHRPGSAYASCRPGPGCLMSDAPRCGAHADSSGQNQTAQKSRWQHDMVVVAVQPGNLSSCSWCNACCIRNLERARETKGIESRRAGGRAE